MVVCCLEYEQIFSSYIRLYFPMAVVKTCYILLLPVANPYLWHKHYSHSYLRNCQNLIFWCRMLGFVFLVSLLQHRAVVGVIPNPSLPRRCGSCQGKSELLGKHMEISTGCLLTWGFGPSLGGERSVISVFALSAEVPSPASLLFGFFFGLSTCLRWCWAVLAGSSSITAGIILQSAPQL